MITNAPNTPPLFDCFSHHIPERIRKMRHMKPASRAGSAVGTDRRGNRTGGKKRGLKAGRQRQARVNVSKLTQKTNAKAHARG